MTRATSPLLLALGAALLGPAPSAQALEVQFEGWYRARGRVFDDLSLDRELATADGTALYGQHRFWLQPRLVPSANSAVYFELRGLDGSYFGQQPYPTLDPVTGLAQAPVLSDALGEPGVTLASGEQAPLLGQGIALWRVWGELDTSVGRFRVGRQPLHWGAGVWQNDGLTNDVMGLKDFGDSADRVSWEHVIQDVYVELAAESNLAGVVNERDGTGSVTATVGYRAERVVAGLRVQQRMAAPGTERSTQLTTGSVSLDAEMGNLAVNFEFVGRYGRGDFGDTATTRDATLTAFGGALDAKLETAAAHVGLVAGIASGDPDANDQKLRTFTFDPDYNLGLILFEQPMPVLSSGGTGDGRSLALAQSYNGVSNAIFAKPTIGRPLREDLLVEASALLARTMASPDEAGERKSYGYELGAAVRYDPDPNVSVRAQGAVLLPGAYYKQYLPDEYTFGDPVLGGQLTATFRF